MSLQNQILSNTNFLLVDELSKLVQIRIGNVRDGAVLHALPAPVAPLIPLPEARQMNRRVRFLGRHHKNINDVLTAGIDQRSYIFAAEDIEKPADQPKSLVRKNFSRGDEGERSV